MDQEMTAIMGSLVELAKSRPNQESTTDSQPLSKPEIDVERVTASVNTYVNEIVPKRFAAATMESCDPKLGPLSSYDGSIFITGPAGTGKTHLAIALLRADALEKAMERAGWDEEKRYRTRKKTYQWETVPEILLALRGSFGDKGRSSEQDIIDAYSDVDFLVLDDLGAEKSTDFSIQSLYLIIDRRYSMEKKTIFTSNLSLSQIAEKVGDRIASRIASCKIVELKGKDKRLNKGGKHE